MNWGMQESKSTHVTASAALTTKRHNVQIARIARDGEGSKVRLRVKGRVPPCRAVPCDQNRSPPLHQTRSTMVGHAVVNPCRPRECVGQSLSYACGEV